MPPKNDFSSINHIHFVEKQNSLNFITHAWLAQSVERKTLNLVAVGSIPTSGILFASGVYLFANTVHKLRVRLFSEYLLAFVVQMVDFFCFFVRNKFWIFNC